jgi:hypothetical protein
MTPLTNNRDIVPSAIQQMPCLFKHLGVIGIFTEVADIEKEALKRVKNYQANNSEKEEGRKCTDSVDE